MSALKTKVAVTEQPARATVPPSLADEAVTAVLEDHEAPPDGLSSVDPEFRREMIATTAYYMAEQRGFAPGHELDDWIAAEAAVDAALRDMPAGTPRAH